MVDKNELIPENSVTVQFNLRGSYILNVLQKGYMQTLKNMGVARFYLWNNTDDITFELNAGADRDAIRAYVEGVTGPCMKARKG
jgi:hypothetical protein